MVHYLGHVPLDADRLAHFVSFWRNSNRGRYVWRCAAHAATLDGRRGWFDWPEMDRNPMLQGGYNQQATAGGVPGKVMLGEYARARVAHAR